MSTETKKTPKPKPAPVEEAEEASSSQDEKTPVRPGKGVKRKNPSPASTPTLTATLTSTPSTTSPALLTTPSRETDDGKPGSGKKRRKSTSSSLALSKVGSPSTVFNPAAMTERQQMAYLLQMTDPQKKPEEPVTAGKDVTVTPGRVHKRNERGETPLHTACIRGDLRLATSLIEQDAEVNATDNAGWTPLHEACNHGHYRLVSLLLGYGAGINTRGMDGDTPLHDATVNNHTEVVKLLLEHGSDPNLANDKEKTPLDVCPNEQMRQLLTSMTVKTKLRPPTDNQNQSTELLVSTRGNRDRVVRLTATVPGGELKDTQQESTEEERDTEKEDSAFLSDPSSTPVLSSHTKSIAGQSVNSSTAKRQQQQLAEATPSRTRRRGKRERGFLMKGKVFSDVSSSESDSELLELVARKVPRLMDRLPASVVEECGTEELQMAERGEGEGEREEREGEGGKVGRGEGEEGREEEIAEDEERGGGSEGEIVVEKAKRAKVKEERDVVEGVGGEGTEKEKEVERLRSVASKGVGKEEGEPGTEDAGPATGQAKLRSSDKPNIEEELIESKSLSGEVAAEKEDRAAPPESTSSPPSSLTSDQQVRQNRSTEHQDTEIPESPESPASPAPMEQDIVGGAVGEVESAEKKGEAEMDTSEPEPVGTSPALVFSDAGEAKDGARENGGSEEEKVVVVERKEGGGEREMRREEGGEREMRREEGGEREMRREEGGEREVRKEGGGEREMRREEGGEREVRKEGGGEMEVRKEGEGEMEVRKEGGGEMEVRKEEEGEREMRLGNEERDEEADPVKLIFSIPFYHIKLSAKKGRGKSPMKFARTSSKDRVPHETFMHVHHGKVESVSSIQRDPLKSDGGSIVSVKTVERQDSSSSQDSRTKAMTEKHTKHSRKPQYVLSAAKKALGKEGRAERGGSGDGLGEGEGKGGWSGDGLSFSMSLGWEATQGGGSGVNSASSKGVSSTRSSKDGRLNILAGGMEGGFGVGRVGDEPGSRASPARTRSKDSDEEEREGEGEGEEDGGQSDDSDSSRGTVVSLSTSLPIVFSGLQQQTPRPSPLVSNTGLSSSTPGSGGGGDGGGGGGGGGSRDLLSVAQQPLARAGGSGVGERVTGGVKRPALIPDSVKGSEMDESLLLPPKLHCRPVLRSAVVQQRREGVGRTPATPSHLPSFLMSSQHYRSRQPHRATSPKAVYPPIHSAMYKLFSEQEAERVQLASAHLTQQDQLVLCMEQELVRAHQRASRQHASTLSVCAVLLERLLPRPEAGGDERLLVEQNGDDGKFREGGQSLDERLLASLVQDVWDKFCGQRRLLLDRQRHEAEAMWMLQHQQWTDRLKDLGFTRQTNFPSIHVPKLFCS